MHELQQHVQQQQQPTTRTPKQGRYQGDEIQSKEFYLNPKLLVNCMTAQELAEKNNFTKN